MSQTITIKTASLLSEIRVKSFMNTERIKDAEERYAVRAGEENNSEQQQAFQDAWRELLSICKKFIDYTSSSSANDTLGTGTEDKTVTFDFAEPAGQSIYDALAQAMHEYLVSGTLRRFYTSASMPDLVKMYATQENAAHASIIELIHYRPYPAS